MKTENIIIIKEATGWAIITDDEKTIDLFRSNVLPTAFDITCPIYEVKAWIEACNPFANVTVA